MYTNSNIYGKGGKKGTLVATSTGDPTMVLKNRIQV